MAEKIVKLGIKLKYQDFLYYIDGSGNVCRRPKREDKGSSEVLVKNAIKRDLNYLYFIDKDGDVARVARTRKGK